MLNKGGNGMKKTLTMQEILNDNQLLNALSKFREESEIKEFCKQHSLEINSTILYNLKKTLECQIEQIENANEPITKETLKEVAGGSQDLDNFKQYAFGGSDGGSVALGILTDIGSLIMQAPMIYMGNEMGKMESLIDERVNAALKAKSNSGLGGFGGSGGSATEKLTAPSYEQMVDELASYFGPFSVE